MNSKIISALQVLLYGIVGLSVHSLALLLTNGGIVIPYGLTGIVLFLINDYESYIQATTGKALFGTIG